ncbi:MAG TPA: hypothetical protein VNO55_25185 [Polyangia bacterium]|nr:hypothetical protein [Polyangia bacterium]
MFGWYVPRAQATVIVGVFALAAAGCGDSTPARDATAGAEVEGGADDKSSGDSSGQVDGRSDDQTTPVDANDAANDADASADVVVDAAADASIADRSDDGASADGLPSFPRTGLPLPDGVRPPQKLLGEAATLTGGRSISSCSHQDPGSGDGHRWCAFSVPAAEAMATELWVIDVTLAASGSIPTCDGSSPSCLRLTTNLWTEFPLIGPGHPYAQAFDGDTLIFYADAISGHEQVHRGPVYAWRPGWTAARKLTSDQGLLCNGSEHAAVAICMDDLRGDPVKPDSFQLRAGTLADQTGGALPLVGQIQPVDRSGHSSWQAGFSRAGDVLAVSSPDPQSGLPVLSVVATGAIGVTPPSPIITDASSWALSDDGHRVYFYGGDLPDSELHELFVANFPDGTGATPLASSVQDYEVLGDGALDRGLVYLTELDASTRQAAFVLMPDAGTPAHTQTLFSYRGFLEGVRLSRDQRNTVWLSGGFVATAVHNDTLDTCTLNTGSNAAFELQILDNAGLVFWTEDANDDLYGRDAYVTTPASCTPKQRFARGMYWYTPVGDRGLVFGDELGSFDRTVTMKYAGAASDDSGWRLKEPVRIDEQADPEFIALDVTATLVLYVKQHGDAATNGTYLFGPVPF